MKGLVHYNYKDLSRAFRFALSFKKLLVLYPLSLLALVMYFKFNYLILFFFVVYYIFSRLIISKLTYEQIKGDFFYEIKRAFIFSLKNIPKYIGFLILIAISLILSFSLFYLFFLVSKLHTILLYISFPFMLFFAVLIFYILIGLIMSESVGINAISTQEYDGFDVFFESFSLFNNQVHRFLLYKLITVAFSIIGFAIMLSVLYLVISFIGFFLKLDKLHILYILTYLIAISYGFGILFIGDLISYLILVYKRDGFDLSKLEPEVHSQRT